MLKIEVLKFATQDVITASVACAHPYDKVNTFISTEALQAGQAPAKCTVCNAEGILDIKANKYIWK